MYDAPWYNKKILGFQTLSKEDKWIAQRLYHIHNKDIDFINSIKMPTQYEIYELKSAISAEELEYPIRSLDCAKTQYCIMNEKDLVEMLRRIYDLQPDKEKIIKYQCPVCKSQSYTSEGKNKKITNLFFDKQMQFYIQLAKQKFQQIVAKSKEPQPKKKIILRRFKNSSIKIYKNGKVQFLYRDTFNQKAQQKICQLLGPTYSKVQAEIYFNPFDQYEKYIKNKDILKIVDRFMEKGIIQYMKQSVNKAQVLGVQNGTIQEYVNTMNRNICEAYEKNITFTTNKESPSPLVMIVKPEEKQAKFLLLKVFQPFQRAWNDYQLKMDGEQNSDMLKIIQRNTQIYINEKTLFLISPKQSYKINLDVKRSQRYEQKQLQSSKSIGKENGDVLLQERGIKNYIILPKQGITSTLIAKKLIQPSSMLQLQGIAYWNKSLFYFGGRKVTISFDRDNYPHYEIKSFSNEITYFNRQSKKWSTLSQKLPVAMHSPTVIQRNDIAYIIGGVIKEQRHATEYSQDITVFDLKNKKILSTTKIERYHYKSMYFVTQSMTPGHYILYNCKEGRYDKNKFTKALIFDINQKNIVGQFQMPNKWAKRSEEQYWKILAYTMSYPSVATNYQGINFMISTDLHNEDIHQLYYGSDSCWLRSGINEKLI